MPNQHTVSVALSEATTKQLLRYIIRAITNLKEELMADINVALANLTTQVTTQLGQTADAIALAKDATDKLAISETEKADLKAQLDAALAANTAAADAIQAQADALAADNPVVEEPAPVEDVPVETVPETPTDPAPAEPVMEEPQA